MVKESFKVYKAVSEGVINLADAFFEMEYHDAGARRARCGPRWVDAVGGAIGGPRWGWLLGVLDHAVCVAVACGACACGVSAVGLLAHLF